MTETLLSIGVLLLCAAPGIWLTVEQHLYQKKWDAKMLEIERCWYGENVSDGDGSEPR